MLDILKRVEERLVRVEGWLLVFLVGLMLSLAVYNVLYRNVLVPIQAKLTIQESAPDAGGSVPPPAQNLKTESVEVSGDDEGFGGGFGDPVSDPPESPSEDEGFGGGFGGGFGSPSASGDDEGFSGGFDGAKKTDIAAAQPAVEPAPKPELSRFAKFVDSFVQAVKLDWIDVLLRHLVLVVGFLGAMLATYRRKHITIDALSKVLPDRYLPWIDSATAALASVICGFLSVSGAEFVKISREYPKELMWFADEWHFQLVFPIGFALLTFHFAIRALEGFSFGLRSRVGGQS